jgi:ring-1,2-phenylacetyl-CoA epoxidase subunit PaaB
MKSLDPRVNRLNLPDQSKEEVQKESLDQLETYEVFIQPKEGRPFQHEGIVHAYDEEVAFVFAKEQFSRRATCNAIMIARTANVFASETTDAGKNVYDLIEEPGDKFSESSNYYVFHLFKRGKQHKEAGCVNAGSVTEAIYNAKINLDPGNPAKPVLNVWIINEKDIYRSKIEDSDIWDTTPEKTFREAMDYKGADIIKKYKEKKENKNDHNE